MWCWMVPLGTTLPHHKRTDLLKKLLKKIKWAIHQSILQILVSGLATAASEPAPQFVFSISVGASLTDIIPRVGAQSKVQPENPENALGSIQDEKVLVRCNAVEISPFSTQATNSASHS